MKKTGGRKSRDTLPLRWVTSVKRPTVSHLRFSSITCRQVATTERLTGSLALEQWAMYSATACRITSPPSPRSLFPAHITQLQYNQAIKLVEIGPCAHCKNKFGFVSRLLAVLWVRNDLFRIRLRLFLSSGSRKKFHLTGSGSAHNYFKKKNKLTTLLSLLKEHPSVFSVHLKQKRLNNFDNLCVFYFCRDLDPKEIIPDTTASGFTTLSSRNCKFHITPSPLHQ